MGRLHRFLFLVPAATALLYACDDHEHETPIPVGDVILEGTVTDEAFVALQSALDQGAPAEDPSRAATLDEPADAAMLPADPAPVFRWHFGATARGPAEPAFRTAALLPVRSQPSDFAAPLRELVGPMRSAHAHGEPFNGTATYLVFSIDSNPELVHVFTSNTTYTPSAEAWGEMTGAGKPITLALVSAIFEQNRVAQDGGPFRGGTITFTVSP